MMDIPDTTPENPYVLNILVLILIPLADFLWYFIF